MTVINNSNKNITLLNGKKIFRYGKIKLEEVSSDLQKQINNLVKMGLIRVL